MQLTTNYSSLRNINESKKMKNKILSLIISLASLNAYAQSSDEKQWDLFIDYLSNNGAKISVSQMNDVNRKATRYNVVFENKDILSKGEQLDEYNRVPKLVDSIKVFLDNKARHSLESYRYENHSGMTDTITYSLALRGFGKKNDYLLDLDKAYSNSFQWSGDGNKLMQAHTATYPSRHQLQEVKMLLSFKDRNRKMWFKAKKTCLFDYVNGTGSLLILSTEENDAKSAYHNFHIDSFDSLLSKTTKEASAKAYPVKYKYDNENEESAGMIQPLNVIEKIKKGTDNATYYHSTLFNTDDLGASESTGTLYVINKGNVKDTYNTLLKSAKAYVNNHPEECCEIEYSNHHFSFSGLRSTTKFKINHIALSDYVLAEMGKDGNLYILRLNVTGDYWIPKGWKQIKTAINGKVTLIK